MPKPVKIKRFFEHNIVLLKFYLILVWILLIQYFVLNWRISRDALEFQLPALMAGIIAWVFQVFDVAARARGSSVLFPDGFSYRIIYHCAGVFGMVIFTSAVLAYPAKIRAKIAGIAVGIPFLFCVNTARMVCLGWIGMHKREWFEFFHESLWQGIFIVFVIFCWMAWKEICVRDEKNRVVSS